MSGLENYGEVALHHLVKAGAQDLRRLDDDWLEAFIKVIELGICGPKGYTILDRHYQFNSLVDYIESDDLSGGCNTDARRIYRAVEGMAKDFPLADQLLTLFDDHGVRDVIRPTLRATTAPINTRKTSPETIAKAERVKQLRAQGLTQQQVADELGVDRSRIAQIESSVSDTFDNINSITNAPEKPTQGGTSREYLEARLARDCPEVLAEVGKEYPSVRAAAIAVGIIKPRINFSVKGDASPEDVAAQLKAKFGVAFLSELIVLLQGNNHESV
jgi:transcriptional regulator with XRE-family HTH domain